MFEISGANSLIRIALLASVVKPILNRQGWIKGYKASLET